MEEDGKLPDASAPPSQQGRQGGSSSGRTAPHPSRTSHDPVHPQSFPFMAPPEYEGFSPPPPPFGAPLGPSFGPYPPLDWLGPGSMFFPPHVNIRLVRPPAGNRRHRRGGRRENSMQEPPPQAEEGGEYPVQGEGDGGLPPNQNANEGDARRRRSRSNNEHEDRPARRRRGGSRSRSPDWRRGSEGGQEGDFPFFAGLPPRREWSGGGPWPFGGRSRSPSVQSRGSWPLPNRRRSTPRSGQVVHNTYIINSHGNLNIYGGGACHFTRRRHEDEEEGRDDEHEQEDEEDEEEGEGEESDYDQDA